jgi:hypothetical protein
LAIYFQKKKKKKKKVKNEEILKWRFYSPKMKRKKKSLDFYIFFNV